MIEYKTFHSISICSINSFTEYKLIGFITRERDMLKITD